MIRTAAEALALLEQERLMTVVPTGSLRSLVAEVVGGPVKGSWWGHPEGGRIFQILTELDDHPDVLILRLVEGKQTLLHRSLFPALLRVVTDEDWRTRRRAKLDANARNLVAAVEERAGLRLDQVAPALRKAKGAVEASLLLHARQIHTERGKHETLLEPWPAFARSAKVKVPARLTIAAALAQLQAAARGSSLPLAAS